MQIRRIWRSILRSTLCMRVNMTWTIHMGVSFIVIFEQCYSIEVCLIYDSLQRCLHTVWSHVRCNKLAYLQLDHRQGHNRLCFPIYRNLIKLSAVYPSAVWRVKLTFGQISRVRELVIACLYPPVRAKPPDPRVITYQAMIGSIYMYT